MTKPPKRSDKNGKSGRWPTNAGGVKNAAGSKTGNAERPRSNAAAALKVQDNKKQVWPPSVLLAPVPAAIITCGSIEKPNALTIAWTGIVNSHPPMTYISVRPERYSHGIILESGEFVINLTTKELCRATDFCGVRSGRNTDKLGELRLSAERGEKVLAPVLSESPLSLECRVKEIIKLGSHDMFLAEIVAVQVASRLIDSDGRLNLKKAGLIAYAHGEYFALGETLGHFGYSVKKPGKAKKTEKLKG